MIQVRRQNGLGRLYTGSRDQTAPFTTCAEQVPHGFGLRNAYMTASGRYASGSEAQAQIGAWAQAVDAHLRQCYGNDIGSAQMQEMYYYTLVMLANERWERNDDERDYEQEIDDIEEDWEQEYEELEEELRLCQAQTCPQPPPCPEPPPCPQAPQAQAQGWGANLGWIVGGAVAGAGLVYFLRRR